METVVVEPKQMIEFLQKQGFSPEMIAKELDDCISYRSIYRWLDGIKPQRAYGVRRLTELYNRIKKEVEDFEPVGLTQEQT